MSTLSRVMAALRGKESPAPESPRYSNPVWWGQSGFIPKDLVLTPEEQFGVSVAWACIRAIVDPIAASEIAVYEESEGERVVSRDWLYWLLNIEPHPEYTSQGWSEVMLTRAVATGNAYAYIQRDGMQRPAALQPLDPARMRADQDEGGGTIYLYDDPTNGTVPIVPADMVHIRGPRTGGFYGDSPLARASAALALAKAQEQYATAYYANGAYPGVLLKPPDNRRAPLSKEDKENARDVWRKLFGGPRKKGGIGSLDPGWSIEVVETDANKAQMVEARKAQVAEIARFFGVPGHLVGVPEASQGYGKNLSEISKSFVHQTLRPWSRRVEEELRRKLMPDRRGRTWFLEYDLGWYSKGDEKSIAEAEQIAVGSGVLTINEARVARGLPTVEGGDATLVNGKPLDQVLDPPEPPAPKIAESPGAEEDAEDAQDPAEAMTAHARRVRARTADLRAKGKGDQEIARAVASLRRRATSELRRALPLVGAPSLAAALGAVEHGIEPEKALAHLRGEA